MVKLTKTHILPNVIFCRTVKLLTFFGVVRENLGELRENLQKRDPTSLVNAVVVCLRESHRCRATFRKCGGFNSLLSIILSLDQCLSFKHSDQNSDLKDVNDDKDFNLSSILLLLRSVFNCLAVAMRFEPANAKFFQVSKKKFLGSNARSHALRTRMCVCDLLLSQGTVRTVNDVGIDLGMPNSGLTSLEQVPQKPHH